MLKKIKKYLNGSRGQDFWSFLNGSTHEYRFNPCTEIDLKGSSDFFFFKKGVRFTLEPFNFTLFTPWTLQNSTKIWHSVTFYPFVLTSKKTLVQKDKCVYDAISSLSVRFRPPNIHFQKRLIKSFRLIIIGESESSYTYIFTRQLSITKYIV